MDKYSESQNINTDDENNRISNGNRTDISVVRKKASVRRISDADLFPIVRIPETSLRKYNKIPASGLASIGAAFTKLPDAARTITQTKTSVMQTSEPLYRAINPKNVMGTLSRGEHGIYGNIHQVNPQGKNVIKGRLQFSEVGNVPVRETTQTTLPLDPTLMVVAVAVMAIEKKLDKIQESVEEVLQFLELEKQATQRGNLKKLAEIADDFKMYCDDKSFCANRNIIVQDIQTKALGNIEFYKEKIASQLQKQKSLHISANANSLMNDVVREFAEYQLSCYIYSYCTFMDIMLRKDFSSESIARCKERMLALAKEYDSLYCGCYDQIERYQHTSVDKKIVGGIGSTIKGLGKVAGNIPIAKDKKIDEALIGTGNRIDKRKISLIENKLEIIKEFKDNRITSFVDNLSYVDMMYNEENSMLTDGDYVYVLQPECIAIS